MGLWGSDNGTWIIVAAIAGLAICQVNLYLTTAVLHRGLCHRAIAYPPWIARSVAAWLWLTSFIPPLTWIAAHRHHHVTADTPDDPHAPGEKGFVRVLLLSWYYVPAWSRTNWAAADARYLQPLRREWLLRVLDRSIIANTNFYAQLALSIAGGPVTLAFWITRVVPYMLLSGYVNSAGHVLGVRRYGDHGTDASGLWQTLLGYIVGGETLGHNYHHRYPRHATFRCTGFDPGFWFATLVLRGVPAHRPRIVQSMELSR